MSSRLMVAMPSRIVDDAWHEFILFTRDYQNFCTQAFDYFLHRTPMQAVSRSQFAENALMRAWSLACRIEKLNPTAPARFPLLFAIDADRYELHGSRELFLACHRALQSDAELGVVQTRIELAAP